MITTITITTTTTGMITVGTTMGAADLMEISVAVELSVAVDLTAISAVTMVAAEMVAAEMEELVTVVAAASD